MQTTANNTIITTLMGGTYVITKAILVGLKDIGVYIITKPDGTLDITSHGNGFRSLTDVVFDLVVRRQELRDITYINKDGLVVELHKIDGIIYIKKIPLCVKSKITSEYNKPRYKAKIQGVSQNVSPYIDAGFGVNNFIKRSDFDALDLQTHHINGLQSDDRPENLATLPSFVHYKLHKRNINRDTELLYDEEAYLGRCLAQVHKERRDELLLNLREFETFCDGVGLTFEHRTKLHKARHTMVKAFDTSTDNKLEVVYSEEFARQMTRLQVQYYYGCKRIKAIEDIEQQESEVVIN